MNHSIQIEGGLFERLMIALDTLSPRLLRVARFVEDHRLATAFMGTRALARRASKPQPEKFFEAVQPPDQVTILGRRYIAPLVSCWAHSLNTDRGGVSAHTQADSSPCDRISLMDAGDLTPVIRFARYFADRVPLLQYPHQPGHRFVFSDIRVRDGLHRSPQPRRGSRLRGETTGGPENETAGQQQ